MERLRLNRTQGVVLGFFVLVWISLVAILVAAPEVYDQALRLPADDRGLPALVFLAAISASASPRNGAKKTHFTAMNPLKDTVEYRPDHFSDSFRSRIRGS